MDMWHGANLMDRSFGRNIAYFYRGQKMKILQWHNGHFLLYDANSQKPVSGDSGNYWDICCAVQLAQVVFTNACLGFGGLSPIFFTAGGQKTSILGNIFDKVWKWWLTVSQL